MKIRDRNVYYVAISFLYNELQAPYIEVSRQFRTPKLIF